MRTSLWLETFVTLATATPLVKRQATVGNITTDGTFTTAQQYANLVRYAQFSTDAYGTTCFGPKGSVLVQEVNNYLTDTQGYVARDDSNKEIIVALRGTSSLVDILTDVGTALVSCNSTGVPYPSGALCHEGFQNAYNSVANNFIGIVRAQLAMHPGYKITVTGHSMGASLASLSSLSMKYNFPHSSTFMYNYGQPRTGDVTFANFYDTSFPYVNGQPTALRSAHADDGVPQVIRQGANGDLIVDIAGLFLIPNNPKATTGYKHHSTEFWQLDPPSAGTTIQCVGQEDQTCQDSQYIFAPLAGINADHLTYYGVDMFSGSTSC